jgi:dolichyl-phosphate mannosyltransferase polypeptide 2 regulatory subunit
VVIALRSLRRRSREREEEEWRASWGVGAMSDRALGGALLGSSIFIFTYYTLWAIILPFLEADHPLQSYFPPRIYAIALPTLLLVLVLLLVLGFLAAAFISSGLQQRRRSADKKKE